jgi:hypothetical protein
MKRSDDAFCHCTSSEPGERGEPPATGAKRNLRKGTLESGLERSDKD